MNKKEINKLLKDKKFKFNPIYDKLITEIKNKSN